LKDRKYFGKLVGSPNLPQVHAELSGWEAHAGRQTAGAADWACGPDRALGHLDDLGITAHLVPWSEDPQLCVCVFAMDDQLYVTFPGQESDVAAQALHFAVITAKSPLT
jgi:hypothetical protein